jgi:hypothetical protein
MFIDFIFIFVAESHLNFQRCRVSRIALFALFDRIFDVIFAKREVYKLQAQMASKVSDRRDIVKDLFQALVEEPLIRILLDLDQVRHLKNFFLS